jgi:nucleotide-binding universal stress UspA family protein
MKRPNDLLLAIEESEASFKAVEYAATWVGPIAGVQVHLLHMLPPLPPELLEFGGAEDPSLEKEMDASIHQGQEAWIAGERAKAEPFFKKVKGILAKHGILEKAIHVHFLALVNRDEMVSMILEKARSQNCGTIVVGRHAFHGLHKILGHHVSDQLVRICHDLTIWVVE